MRSKVVDEITYPGVDKITYPECIAQYFGQTKRHIETIMTEHGRSGSPIQNHFGDCVLAGSDVRGYTRIIDWFSMDSILLNLKAIYNSDTEPQLSSLEDFTQRNLTLRF